MMPETETTPELYEKLPEKPVTFRVPEGDLVDLDRIVEFEKRRAKGHVITRSSVIRVALRLFLNERLKRISS